MIPRNIAIKYGSCRWHLLPLRVRHNGLKPVVNILIEHMALEINLNTYQGKEINSLYNQKRRKVLRLYKHKKRGYMANCAGEIIK